MSSYLLFMFLSPYAHIFPWPDDPALLLLYSGRNSATALVPAEFIADLEAGREVDAESGALLSELGLLTDDPEGEKEEVRGLVEELNRLRRVMNVSVVVNMRCNFRCRYCYEGERKDNSVMSRETAARLVEFIKTRFPADCLRLTLDFYGGEPLLSVELIRAIAAPLKEFAEGRGAVFEITLVTNGSLLTPAVVGRLRPVGLKRAKVTIDGPPEIHNHFRPYASGQPSFATVINNVGRCADLIGIGINGNFTRENYQRFPELFDYLDGQGITPDRLLRLSFSPVLMVGDAPPGAFCGGCASCNEPWLTEAAPFLHDKIMARGYKTDTISVSLCMVEVDNSFVVHHDGSLYQCVALVGQEDYACGDIRAGMRDYRDQYHLDHWRQNKECRDCRYLPLCFGGCRYMALQREGHMAEVDCWKKFFAANLERMVRQDIRQTVGQVEPGDT